MPRVFVLLVLSALAVVGCKGASAPGEARVDLDSDPLARLPGSALVVVNLDAHALFSSPASAGVGARVAALAESLLPLGARAGFEVRRDVDRVVLGVYTSSGVDVAAVIRGRFDEAKIAATASAGEGGLVRGMYAGRVTYARGPAMFSVLTASTAVAGTGDGLRRLLERVEDHTIARAMPSWVADTLATPGADLALVADFTAQPLAVAAVGAIPLPWLQGMLSARVIANFASPGMNVAGTLSYADPEKARSAATMVETAQGWMSLVGAVFGGISPQNLEVSTDGKDMKCKFALSDQALANLLAFLPRSLPGPP